MKEKYYYFTFFDSYSNKTENLEVKAKTFAEATPNAYIYQKSLMRKNSKSSWDIVSVKSDDFKKQQGG